MTSTCLSLDFEDGNVALIFANSPQRHRVHKSILTANIPFFADLFELATPPEEDIPTVELPDDEEAFVLVLRSLYRQE
jgi:hypothetical protein